VLFLFHILEVRVLAEDRRPVVIYCVVTGALDGDIVQAGIPAIP
jgi:hypothetical protein